MKLLTKICLLLCLASCHSKEESNTKIQSIDTLKLFDPSGENDGIERIIRTKNAIILQKDFYAINLGNNEYPIVGKDLLSKFIRDSAQVIKRNKFYIIIDSSRSFKDIVDILDILKTAGIESYQVFNLQTKVKADEPPVIQSPQLISKEIGPRDSTYLKIVLQPNNYKISLLTDSLTTSDIKMVDKFISVNKLYINENKIHVTGSRNTSVIQFKELRRILKKHKYFRFSMSTEPLSSENDHR